MPELPEVETVRRALALCLTGRRVVAVEGEAVRLRQPLDPAALAMSLVGRTMARFRRRGKYLLLDGDNHGSLLVHLGMSGRLTLDRRQQPLLPHTHLVLTLEDQRQLRYVDPRRFGLVEWLPAGSEAHHPTLAGLGPDPLDDDLVESLPPRLRCRRAPVKSLLLDQRLLAGVGNIYATEALWRAGIRPSRAASTISLARLRRLTVELQAVLAEAVTQGGTTLRDFASPSGDFGSFAVSLQAYGREGEPCRRCSRPLRRAVVGGRSSAWCPGCQR